MKKQLTIVCLYVVMVACDHSSKPQSTGNQKSVGNREGATTYRQPANSNNILGEWHQHHAVIDQNGNALLDPEDRNGTKSTMGFNYFQFNDDGKCLYDSDVKFKGNYEIIEDNGKRKLNITVNGFGETYKYTIVDPVTDELILYSSGAFMIFKKK